jgi:hypothetical protein
MNEAGASSVIATAEQQRAFLAGDEIAYDGVISALWREKMNTHSIGRALRVPESLVANRLAALRDSGAL